MSSPNLNLDRGGNAMEGLYATNIRLMETMTIMSNNLVGAVSQDQASVDRIRIALKETHDVAQKVASLADQGRMRVKVTQNPLMTELPDFDRVNALPAAQRNDEVPDKRNVRLAKPFCGGTTTAEAPVECRAHLAEIMDIATANNLTEKGTIKLLKMNVGKDLALMVGEMIESKATLEEIVRKIETMYGGLKTPEQAQLECHRATRYPMESLMVLSRRIKHLAYMACRMKATKKEVREAAEVLAKETFIACVSIELRNSLRALADQKLALGLKPMDYETLVSEAKRLEDEKKTEKIVARARGSQHDNTIRMCEMEGQELDLNDENIEEVQYNEFGEVLRIIRKPNFYSSRGRGRGQGQKKFFPVRRSNPMNTPQYVRQVEEDEYGYGEDEIQSMAEADIEVYGSCLLVQTGKGNGQSFQKIDPRKMNVTPDQCIKCGISGHRAYGALADRCPLKNQPLVATVCSFCNKGAHMSTQCPRRGKM